MLRPLVKRVAGLISLSSDEDDGLLGFLSRFYVRIFWCGLWGVALLSWGWFFLSVRWHPETPIILNGALLKADDFELLTTGCDRGFDFDEYVANWRAKAVANEETATPDELIGFAHWLAAITAHETWEYSDATAVLRMSSAAVAAEPDNVNFRRYQAVMALRIADHVSQPDRERWMQELEDSAQRYPQQGIFRCAQACLCWSSAIRPASAEPQAEWELIAPEQLAIGDRYAEFASRITELGTPQAPVPHVEGAMLLAGIHQAEIPDHLEQFHYDFGEFVFKRLFRQFKQRVAFDKQPMLAIEQLELCDVMIEIASKLPRRFAGESQFAQKSMVELLLLKKSVVLKQRNLRSNLADNESSTRDDLLTADQIEELLCETTAELFNVVSNPESHVKRAAHTATFPSGIRNYQRVFFENQLHLYIAVGYAGLTAFLLSFVCWWFSRSVPQALREPLWGPVVRIPLAAVFVVILSQRVIAYHEDFLFYCAIGLVILLVCIAGVFPWLRKLPFERSTAIALAILPSVLLAAHFAIGLLAPTAQHPVFRRASSTLRQRFFAFTEEWPAQSGIHILVGSLLLFEATVVGLQWLYFRRQRDAPLVRMVFRSASRVLLIAALLLTTAAGSFSAQQLNSACGWYHARRFEMDFEAYSAEFRKQVEIVEQHETLMKAIEQGADYDARRYML